MESKHTQRTRANTTLFLLQNLRELGLGGPLGLALVQALGAELLLGEGGRVGVESQQDLLVDERVLLLHTGALGLRGALGSSDDGLDFGRVDQTADVSLVDDGGGEEEVLLEGGWGGGGAVDLVQGGEGGRGPDDEAAEVSTRGELEEVQGEDGRGLDTGNVAECANDLLTIDFGVVDDQRTAALAVTAATELTLTSAELAGLLDLLDIWGCTN